MHVLEICGLRAGGGGVRDLGGMQIVVQRLKHEAEDALAEHAAAHGTRAEAEATATRASASASNPGLPRRRLRVAGKPFEEKPAPYPVSSTRRVLLKALMRALALTNLSPGTNNVKVAGLEDGTLCAALNLVAPGFGAVFAGRNLLCDVMNHGRRATPSWRSRVPQTFLEAREGDDPGPSLSADALCCLLNALGALCLPLGGAGEERARRARRGFTGAYQPPADRRRDRREHRRAPAARSRPAARRRAVRHQRAASSARGWRDGPRTLAPRAVAGPRGAPPAAAAPAAAAGDGRVARGVGGRRHRQRRQRRSPLDPRPSQSLWT